MMEKMSIDSKWTVNPERKDVLLKYWIKKIIKLEKNFLAIFDPTGPPTGGPIFPPLVKVSKK